MTNRNSNPRRYLIAAGTRHYLDHPELPEAHNDVERIVELFTSNSMGYERVLGTISEDPEAAEFEDALAEWCTEADRKADDVVVLYYAGHGDVPVAGPYRLACASSVAHRPRTWLSLENLAAVFAASPVRNVLFVIDACNAAAGAGEISSVTDAFAAARPRSDKPGAGTWILASARHRDLAGDGVFAAQLASAYGLGDGPSQKYLSPAKLADRITKAFERDGHRQRAACSVADQSVQPPFFPNPAFDAHAEIGLEGRSQGDATDLSSHFEPRGRGVEHVHDPGSYFTGRRHALDVLRVHLTGPGGRGALVVTGAPGSGKSAVLGRLVLDGAGTDSPHHIDVSVNARHQTMDALVARLAAAADLSASTPTALLTALAGREQPFRVVVDSLDEAGPTGDRAEARRIAWELLRPLGTLSCIHLIVGARRELLLHIGDRLLAVDLDEAEYADDTSTADYVERILTDSGAPYEFTPTARIISEAVAERAGGCFLVARMTATALERAERIDVTVPGWAEKLPSDVGGAFEAYLERIPRLRRQAAISLMTALAFGEGHGLPRSGIWTGIAARLSGMTLTETDIDTLVEEDGSYLTVVEVDDRKYFRLYHQELADHLKGRALGHRDFTDIQECFVRTLTDLVGDAPRWSRAHPYVRGHLATHAAAAGVIDDFIDDPEFVLAVDIAGLLPAVQHAKRNPLLAMVVERCADMLGGAAGWGVDRAAQLAFVAETHGASDFARRAAQLSNCIERVRVEPRRVTPHRIVGRHKEGTYSTTSGFGGWEIRDLVTPQGKQVVIAASLGAPHVYVWMVADPSQATILPHQTNVKAVEILHETGRALVVTLDEECALRVWDVVDQSLVQHLPDTGFECVLDTGSLSDGTSAIVCHDGQQFVVFDPLLGRTLLKVPCALPKPRAWWAQPSARLVHCGDESVWLLGCDQGNVSLHPVEGQLGGGAVRKGMRRPSIVAKADGPERRTIVAISEMSDSRQGFDRRLSLLDVGLPDSTTTTGNDVRGLRGGAFVERSQAAPVFVGASDRGVFTLAIGAGLERRPVKVGTEHFTVAPLTSDGRTHAVVADIFTGGIRVLDYTTGQPVGRPLYGHESSISAIHLLGSSDCDVLHILAVGNDGTARLWNWSHEDAAVSEGVEKALVSEFAKSHTEMLRSWSGRSADIVAASWAGIRIANSAALDDLMSVRTPPFSRDVLETSQIKPEQCAEDPDGTLNLLAKVESHDFEGEELPRANYLWHRLRVDDSVETNECASLSMVPWEVTCHVIPPSSSYPSTRIVAYDPGRGEIRLLHAPGTVNDTVPVRWPAGDSDTVASTAFARPDGHVVLFAGVRGANRGDRTIRGEYLTRNTDTVELPTRGHLWDVTAGREVLAETLALPAGVKVLVPYHNFSGTRYIAMAGQHGRVAVLDLESGKLHTVRTGPQSLSRNLSGRGWKFRDLASGNSHFIRWADRVTAAPMLLYVDSAEADDMELRSVTVWDAADPDRERHLPMPVARLLWTGQAPNGETLVAVSDEHGVALCHLPSCEKIWSAPLPALVTSLVALPNLDLAVSTQQGIVLLRPRLPAALLR